MNLPAQPTQGTFYQRGLGLKQEVKGSLKKDYHSYLIEYLEANDYMLTAGGLTIHLAREFGFCYGVDRAVEYAYQTRERFPSRKIFLTGEIIHNPHVNNRLIEMDIQFLSGQYSNGMKTQDLMPDDVVILPAFGISIHEFQALRRVGCVLVDTTCGSVLNVWKRVAFYAENGYTSIIHGKHSHEETIATSSQALKYPDGHYLIVKDMAEADTVSDYILKGGDKIAFLNHFKLAISPGFDPDLHLEKVGVANQTTMLSSESLAIADKFRQTITERSGASGVDRYFLTFDTICSATQDRQDAVLALVTSKKLDLMIVIGGFNSSNTTHLAEITSQYTDSYHIDDPASMLSTARIRHRRTDSREVVFTRDWLPAGDLAIGITAGASTPNNKIAESIERILAFRKIEVDCVLGNR